MQDAPQGAVFISCNRICTDYHRSLARFLGRDDLEIVTPYWLEERHSFRAVIVDHAVRLNDRQWRGLRVINELRRRHSDRISETQDK